MAKAFKYSKVIARVKKSLILCLRIAHVRLGLLIHYLALVETALIPEVHQIILRLELPMMSWVISDLNKEGSVQIP